MSLSGALSTEMSECCSNVMKQMETTFIKRINTIDFQNERISFRLFAILKDIVFFYHLIKYLKGFMQKKHYLTKDFISIYLAKKFSKKIRNNCKKNKFKNIKK